MRAFTIDKFNTWHDWRLTLTAKDVAPAEPKTNYVYLDGAHGSLDLTEALTGEVAYNDRTVTASFWTSEGTFNERLRVLQEIVSATHGRKVRIVEPDDPEHYFLGRVKVKSQKWDQVHMELSLEATCEPWRYAIHETERVVKVSGDASVVINNYGVKTLCPTLVVSGSVGVNVNGATRVLTNGTFQITDLKLRQGVNVVGVSGKGTLTFVYREASL